RIPRSLRKETVIVYPYRGQGAYGPIYDDPVTYAPPMCGVYVEPGNRQAVDATGQEVVANAAAFFGPEAEGVPTNSLAVWQGRTYRVIDVQPLRPFGRTNHVEVVLGGTDEEVPE